MHHYSNKASASTYPTKLIFLFLSTFRDRKKKEKDVLVDVRISITDCAEIALEMANIDWIEPNLTDQHQVRTKCPNAIVN